MDSRCGISEQRARDCAGTVCGLRILKFLFGEGGGVGFVDWLGWLFSLLRWLVAGRQRWNSLNEDGRLRIRDEEWREDLSMGLAVGVCWGGG